MRLYLNKENIKEGSINKKKYIEVNIWSMAKCTILSTLWLYLWIIGIFVVLGILFSFFEHNHLIN